MSRAEPAWYPLVLEPRYDERPWGDQRLATILGKPCPADRPIGESWETGPTARVLNGPLAGVSLHELVQRDPRGLLGERGQRVSGSFADFPLLAKFIDANQTLSVQVHPNDEQAQPLHARGKTEAWHILAAEPGSFLITGLTRFVATDELRAALTAEQLDPLLERVVVRPGETVFVPAGTIHAIGAGILLYEIQEASDVTFRLYDWGRRDAQGRTRPLHVEEALAVLQPRRHARRVRPLALDPIRTVLAACRYFVLERWHVRGLFQFVADPMQSFSIMSCIDGAVSIRTGTIVTALQKGQTAVIPAALPHLLLEGDAALLVSRIPDLWRDVVVPLRSVGYDDGLIAQLAGETDDLRALLPGAGGDDGAG
ncbi:MAG: mannose-6-phosphate isomerase [Thermorudis peleae]|nr:mannose-6-phosphate isomerase [Thermorudis peleae]